MPTQRSKPTLNFRPCRTDAELAAYARLTSLAFGRTQSEAADWLKARKPQDIRVLTDAPRTRSTPERTMCVPQTRSAMPARMLSKVCMGYEGRYAPSRSPAMTPQEGVRRACMARKVSWK